MEQILRDARIAPIYEGTNGIQALDLLGRKVLASNGDLLAHFTAQIRAFVESESGNQAMTEFLPPLMVNVQRWEELSAAIAVRAKANPDEMGAASFDYLMYAGYTVIGYLWAKSASVALKQLAAGTTEPEFYQSKVKTARFYFQRLLTRNEGLAQNLAADASTLMDMDEDQFNF